MTTTCSICHEEFEGFGHNPEPLLDYAQRCCEECNFNVVVPMRLFGPTPEVRQELRKHGFEASMTIRRTR